MKSLLVLALMFFSMSAMATDVSTFGPAVKVANSTDIVTIETTAFNPTGGGNMAAIKGSVIGMKYAPSGDYRVRILNQGFKGERFYTMVCRLKNYLEDSFADVGQDYAMLSTALTAMDGTTYNVIGYYSGLNAYPSQDYKIIILNGDSVEYWNSMNCRVK